MLTTGGTTAAGASRPLVIAAAVGAGLNGGVFFAFSSFVMPALDRLPASQAVAAMQSVNVTAVRAPFMTALFGTALLGGVVAFQAARHRGSAGSTLLLVGGAVYLIGVVGVTIAANVPLNDTLATVDPASAGAAHAWSQFSGPWTGWNTVRTLAGLASAALLTVGATRT